MKNLKILLAILTTTLILTLTFASCGGGGGGGGGGTPADNSSGTDTNPKNPSGNDVQPGTFISTDGTNTYELEIKASGARAAIKDGDSYTLTVTGSNSSKIGTSTGTVKSADKGKLKLLDKNNIEIDVVINGNRITSLGEFYLDDGKTKITPKKISTAYSSINSRFTGRLTNFSDSAYIYCEDGNDKEHKIGSVSSGGSFTLDFKDFPIIFDYLEDGEKSAKDVLNSIEDDVKITGKLDITGNAQVISAMPYVTHDLSFGGGVSSSMNDMLMVGKPIDYSSYSSGNITTFDFYMSLFMYADGPLTVKGNLNVTVTQKSSKDTSKYTGIYDYSLKPGWNIVYIYVKNNIDGKDGIITIKSTKFSGTDWCLQMGDFGL